MIEKKASEVVEKIDTAIEYVKNSDTIEKAKEVVSAAKEKVEDFDLSDFIGDKVTAITSSAAEKIDNKITSDNNTFDNLSNLQKNNATIDAASLEKNVYKVDNVDEISNPDNDKNYVIKKTTIGLNGEDLEYSTKQSYSDGTIVYKDKDGNKIKTVNADGTVTINGKTINSDGTVTDSMGRILLKDGSYYYSTDTDTTIKKDDGSEYIYDANGKLTKVVDSDGNFTYYNYDEDGNVKTIDYNQKEPNGDGSYREVVYDSDGSYTVTDTSYNDFGSTEYKETVKYDKNGNIVSSDNVTIDGQYEIRTEGNKKTIYDTANDRKYTEETNGNETTKTYYNSDGSIDKTEKYENGEVVETKSNYSNGDYKITDKNGNSTEYYANGTPKSTENNGTKTYYYENGDVSRQYNADGSEVSYNEDGSKIYEKFADGTAQYYNSDGSVDYYDENMNIIKEVKPDGSEVYWNWE